MKKERAASFIFFFVGLYGLIYSVKFPMGKLKAPGPGVFPLGLSILLCISGILWFIRGKREAGERIDKIDWATIRQNLATPAKIVGLTAAFILSMDHIGFLLASTLYIFFLFLWISRYKLWISTGLAIVIGVSSWYLFEKFLAVQFPSGIWFQ
jgi:putative tricarboxylic transport membrane protein